jgi:CHAT domain-containing protein
MFRRFRRAKKATTPPPETPPMLPPPSEEELWRIGGQPTDRLRVIRPEDLPRLDPAQRERLAGPGMYRPAQTRPLAPPRAPGQPVDPEEVAQALEEYVNAPDWETSRAVVEQHPELLSNTALMLLRANVSRVAEKIGPAASQVLARYLQTLEVAQREGIDFAFERMPWPHEASAADLDAILAQLEAPELAYNLEARVQLSEMGIALAAREQDDLLWAALQRELGLILPRLRSGDHTQNVERAIESLDAALQIFTKMEFPSEWGLTQHYLGLAFLARELGDPAGNVEQGIEALEAALEVRTRDDAPNEWAATQEALGSAYYLRGVGTRAENLDHAIAALEAALEVRTRDRAPYEWATDQLSLGNAYGQRINGTRMGNIEQAITGFEAALTYFTRENTPDQWALICHNLGVAYMDRLFGNHADNIERALDYYEQSAFIQTRERSPLEWADTRNNLGNAYRERVVGDRAENQRKAITSYQEALRIRTRDAFPAEHRRTARNLALLLFELGRWAEAHDMFASAIAASETLYLLGIGTTGPTPRLREHGELVAHDAFCLLKMNRPRDAAQRLESGRARALDEMLERDRLALLAVPAADRVAFERAQALLQTMYENAQRITSAGGDLTSENLRLSSDERPSTLRRSLDDLAFERRNAQAAFDAAVAAIRKTRGDFLHPPLSFKQIAGAAAKDQALIYLGTTEQGSLALIIPGGVAELRDEHILFAPNLTTDRIEKLAPRTDDEETVVKTQLGNLPRPNVLDAWLSALGETLMAPLAARLAQLHLDSVALIPTGRIATWPLHAAPIGEAAPIRDDESDDPQTETRPDALFLDAFEVAYAPSAQRLMMARAAASVVLRSGVAAVGNPQPASVALEWAEHEAEAIAQVTSKTGQSCTLLIRRKANAASVKKALQERAYVHLACASAYYPERPIESYLELAEGDMLRTRDILTGEVRARGVRVAVLSAGQSAMTATNAPDESISMATAMLVGGVAGVAACLWPASDLATLLLMRRFAELYLSQEQRPAQALRNAQRWLRGLSLATLTRDYGNDIARDPDLTLADFALPQDTPFAHPFYWASFALHGA